MMPFYDLGFAEVSLPGLMVFLFAVYAAVRFLFPGTGRMFQRTPEDDGGMDLD